MNADDDLVSIPDVEALGDSDGILLTCRLKRRLSSRVIVVSSAHIDATSEVRRPGDCGTLVIPRLVARDLKLID
jgi:hypothetical protein